MPEPLAASDDRILPREAIWFFVVAPPFLSLLFDPSCLWEPAHVTRALVAMTLYMVVTGLLVHFSFEWSARRLGKTGIPRIARIALYAIGSAAVVALTTLVLLPVVLLIYPELGEDAFTVVAGRAMLVGWAYLAGARFVRSLQRRAVEDRLRSHRQRTSVLEARLAALTAQTRPHFLFNALNTIASLIHDDPDLAEDTLERMAGLLRYALASTDKKLVRLDEELAMVRGYLEIQQLRFGDRMTFHLETDPAADEEMIPPMLIHPLVENAILHGLRGQANGVVTITTRYSDERLEVVVEDDGVGPGGSQHEGAGTGLRTVEQRLTLMFGERASFETGPAARTNGGGFRCAIVIEPEAPGTELARLSGHFLRLEPDPL